MSIRNEIEIPTTELKIPLVVGSTPCMKHGARVGHPCFKVYRLDRDGYLPGICNQRALKFGFVGQIDPRSLERAPRTGNYGLRRS